jgi:bisphosphoglycerate-dependent phosphoglycerate mutase
MTTCQYLELIGHHYRVLGGYEKFDVPVRYTFNKVQFIERTTQEHTPHRKEKKKTKKGKATVEATTMEALYVNAHVSKLFDDFHNSTL